MNKADDLRLWRYFLAVADRGGIALAAESEGVEISTVSRAIAQLEKSVGHPLINRKLKPFALTDLGQTILPKIRRVLEMQDALLDELHQDNEEVTGEIRLSVSPGFAATKLTSYLAQFNQLYPRVSFRITPGKTVDDLLKGYCDITVKTGEVNAPNDEVVTFYRGHNYYLPLASAQYIAKHGKITEPKDLAKCTVYRYNGPIREETLFLTKEGRIEAIQSLNAISIPSIQAVRNSVLASLGVAVDLTWNKCVEDVLAGRLVPILPGWFRPPSPVYTVVSRSAWMLRRVRLFAKWFNDQMYEKTRKDNETLRKFYKTKYHIVLPTVTALPMDNAREKQEEQ